MLLCMALVGVTVTRAEQSLTSAEVAADAAPASELLMADKVVVQKAARKLTLYRRGVALREYPMHLGLQPEGPKQTEGDFRTPEGRYYLSRRNAQSSYFLAVQVDYPNQQDIARAKRLGVDPGGAIMVHGLPNTPTRPADYYQRFDWTDGCIALSNTDMVEFWLMTRSGIPIDILP
ncbi:MAG: murein L,D-transpeptidase family protein [Steroidobacteraceae bacterium]